MFLPDCDDLNFDCTVSLEMLDEFVGGCSPPDNSVDEQGPRIRVGCLLPSEL